MYSTKIISDLKRILVQLHSARVQLCEYPALYPLENSGRYYFGAVSPQLQYILVGVCCKLPLALGVPGCGYALVQLYFEASLFFLNRTYWGTRYGTSTKFS